MAKAGKRNGIVLQGQCSNVSGVDRDIVQEYDGIERDYITYGIKTDQDTAGVTTCRLSASLSTGTVYWVMELLMITLLQLILPMTMVLLAPMIYTYTLTDSDTVK